MKKEQEMSVVPFLHKDGKLFLAKRAATKKRFPNLWELAGGRVDFGESLEDALVREMEEEFGVKVKVGSLFDAFTYVTDDGSTHSVELAYFVTLASADQKIVLDPAEHSEYTWATEEDLEELSRDDNPAEYKVAKRGFKLLKKGYANA